MHEAGGVEHERSKEYRKDDAADRTEDWREYILDLSASGIYSCKPER